MTADAATLPINQAKAPGAEKQWSLTARVGFRFAFCYWVLYCLPGAGRVSLMWDFPGQRYIFRPFLWVWRELLPWLALHVFHLSGTRTTFFPTGSGDTTLDYIQNLLFIVVAVVATIAWSALDRRRGEYRTVHGWLRIFLRFTLAATLFSYGFSKVIPLQFQQFQPGVMRLTETYGASSPMGLLWTFMGASTPYTVFAGLAEVFAGFLLLFRRTALLGALVAAGVLLNVAMLNFCYDVPVKLYSTNLLLMALFLALPDISRLVNFLLLNREAPPADLAVPFFPKRWMRIGANALVLIWFISFSAMALRGRWLELKNITSAAKAPIDGGFDVQTVQINGRPASTVDPANADWKQFFAGSNYWVVRRTDGTESYFRPIYSPLTYTHSVELQSVKARESFQFTYSWKGAQDLVLTGKLGSENVVAHLKRIDESKFLLNSRGFHWISEKPFNR